jgi:hypothetical protein
LDVALLLRRGCLLLLLLVLMKGWDPQLTL